MPPTTTPPKNQPPADAQPRGTLAPQQDAKGALPGLTTQPPDGARNLAPSVPPSERTPVRSGLTLDGVNDGPAAGAAPSTLPLRQRTDVATHLLVRTRHGKSFRRAGLEFGTAWTAINRDQISAETERALRSEPLLDVQEANATQVGNMNSAADELSTATREDLVRTLRDMHSALQQAHRERDEAREELSRVRQSASFPPVGDELRRGTDGPHFVDDLKDTGPRVR